MYSRVQSGLDSSFRVHLRHMFIIYSNLLLSLWVQIEPSFLFLTLKDQNTYHHHIQLVCSVDLMYVHQYYTLHCMCSQNSPFTFNTHTSIEFHQTIHNPHAPQKSKENLRAKSILLQTNRQNSSETLHQNTYIYITVYCLLYIFHITWNNYIIYKV